MDYREFIEHYEAQGMEIQAEEVERDEWFLQAVDRTGATVASLPVPKETVQELHAAQRLARTWGAGETT